jgi:hypothetical protein
LSGIVYDVRDYVTNYGELLKHDLKEEVRDLKVAVIAGSVAAYSLGAGLLLLAMGAGYFIASLADWPVEGGLALVGLVVSLAGVIAVAVVARKVSNAGDEVSDADKPAKDAKWISDNT